MVNKTIKKIFIIKHLFPFFEMLIIILLIVFLAFFGKNLYRLILTNKSSTEASNTPQINLLSKAQYEEILNAVNEKKSKIQTLDTRQITNPFDPVLTNQPATDAATNMPGTASHSLKIP